MSWFKRSEKNITTPTAEKKDAPNGLWFKTPTGKIIHMKELKNNCYVSPEDGYHVKIGSREYFEILFDGNEFTEIAPELIAGDPLNFSDTKSYVSRLQDSRAKTGLNDAARSAYGKMNGVNIVVACMDFEFIGGSMGSVVGEKIARAIDVALENRWPLVVISRSGGARMMEAGFSLMQMAKTSAKLALLHEAGVPYVSLMTDPTTGGVSASFAMLGDFNIAEPGALIGFAGPRVIRETIGKDLPKGFQTAEFLLEHGFLDFIVDRRQLKTKLTLLFNMLK
ncbi:acetyl-CoA carboxylase, carboxyltransferase subunit beta [Rhodoflexus caldus]|uniref:acetyl-CoA carboxylase, carboxyltransferase subunit beta n=1 Tax=Rhodoflexus caldus TaxID=2891236 RepID=UPI00202A207C|nr:acetyl-CoA carboxylase, carboxyltransferase subunit beta [Rhodoflexus caldus]